MNTRAAAPHERGQSQATGAHERGQRPASGIPERSQRPATGRLARLTAMWQGGLGPATPQWLAGHGWQVHIQRRDTLAAAYGRPVPSPTDGAYITAVRPAPPGSH